MQARGEATGGGSDAGDPSKRPANRQVGVWHDRLMRSWLARRWAPWLAWLLGTCTVLVGVQQSTVDLGFHADSATDHGVVTALAVVQWAWLAVVTVFAGLSELGGRQAVPYRTILVAVLLLWPIATQWMLVL